MRIRKVFMVLTLGISGYPGLAHTSGYEARLSIHRRGHSSASLKLEKLSHSGGDGHTPSERSTRLVK